jgi:hypothetical protein
MCFLSQRLRGATEEPMILSFFFFHYPFQSKISFQHIFQTLEKQDSLPRCLNTKFEGRILMVILQKLGAFNKDGEWV